MMSSSVTLFKNSENSALITKLQSALHYVNSTCVFGAPNRIEDVKRTGAWVTFSKFRAYAGKYMTRQQLIDTGAKIGGNQKFDPKKKTLVVEDKKWYFQNVKNALADFTCKQPGIDPLSDSAFKLSHEQKEVLTLAMYTQQLRYGHCSFSACLLAKYLWENPTGIQTIEVVSMSDFEHVIVLVNRSGELEDPSTWKKGWVIDTWHKKEEEKGLIYPASQFTQKIKETKKFALSQKKSLYEVGIIYTDHLFDKSQSTRCILQCKITPHTDLYPTYSTQPFLPVEHYYLFDNHPINLDPPTLSQAREDHQQKFSHCLTKIRK